MRNPVPSLVPQPRCVVPTPPRSRRLVRQVSDCALSSLPLFPPKAGEDGSSPRVGFSPYQLSLGEVHDVSTMLEKLSLGRTGLGKDVGRHGGSDRQDDIHLVV